MNRYPLKQLSLGNINISPVLTGRELGYTESAEELTQILSKFNYKDILIQLARINLLLQRSKDFQGKYTVSLPHPEACVAVKIIDMLGEETVVTA